MDKAPDAFRTISEVADDLDVPQHVLRFWETRFSQIKPMKRSGGRRYYRPDDVALLRGIRRLLYGEGYTIRGVQRILKEQGIKAVQALADGESDLLMAAKSPARAAPPLTDPDVFDAELSALSSSLGDEDEDDPGGDGDVGRSDDDDDNNDSDEDDNDFPDASPVLIGPRRANFVARPEGPRVERSTDATPPVREPERVPVRDETLQRQADELKLDRELMQQERAEMQQQLDAQAGQLKSQQEQLAAERVALQKSKADIEALSELREETLRTALNELLACRKILEVAANGA